MSVSQASRSMTHREYLCWLLRIEERFTEPTPEHYYLAQIAQEIRRVLSKSPNKIKLKHFLLQFLPKGKTATQQNLTKADIELRKQTWWGFVTGGSGEKMEATEDG